MTFKVAINGFGRIGRTILRAHYENKKKHDLEIVAINGSGNADDNAHLLKDILFDLGNLSGINIGVYLFVFCTTAIVLVRYKIAPQWVVLGTLLLGAFLTIWPSIF